MVSKPSTTTGLTSELLSVNMMCMQRMLYAFPSVSKLLQETAFLS